MTRSFVRIFGFEELFDIISSEYCRKDFLRNIIQDSLGLTSTYAQSGKHDSQVKALRELTSNIHGGLNRKIIE